MNKCSFTTQEKTGGPDRHVPRVGPGSPETSKVRARQALGIFWGFPHGGAGGVPLASVEWPRAGRSTH